MIRSMTGYGHAEVSGVRLSLSVECKSLNHRHLDIALRLPRGLSALELDARRVIQGAVQRGRVEVSGPNLEEEGRAVHKMLLEPRAWIRPTLPIPPRFIDQSGSPGNTRAKRWRRSGTVSGFISRP